MSVSMYLRNHLCSLSLYGSMNASIRVVIYMYTLICVKIYILVLIGAFAHLSIYLFRHISYKTSKQCTTQERCSIHHVSRSIKLNIYKYIYIYCMQMPAIQYTMVDIDLLSKCGINKCIHKHVTYTVHLLDLIGGAITCAHRWITYAHNTPSSFYPHEL